MAPPAPFGSGKRRVEDMYDFHDMPGHLVRRLHQISGSIFAERMAAAGQDITPVQYATLSAIASAPKLDQVTLAGLVACDRVTVGGVIDRLEQKRLVRRVVNEQDRRARQVQITAEGQRVLTTIHPIVADLQSEILHGLSDSERAAFLRLLKKTTRAGNEMSRAPHKALS